MRGNHLASAAIYGMATGTGTGTSYIHQGPRGLSASLTTQGPEGLSSALTTHDRELASVSEDKSRAM